MTDLTGRTALISGASRGIGAAIARTLAARGADIAINYHSSRDAAEAVAKEVRSLERRAAVFQADVTDEAECGKMVDAVLSEFGSIGILINNAGIGSASVGQPPVADMSDADLQKFLNTHVFGPLHLCRAIVPQMRKLKRGDVVMISSIAAQLYAPRMAVYGIAKAGMEALAYTLAKEEREHRIRVNVVAPGLVNTDMGKSLMQFRAGIQDLHKLDADSPFGFVCEPDDIANTVAFLVSDAARYITNQRITVNGGGF